VGVFIREYIWVGVFIRVYIWVGVFIRVHIWVCVSALILQESLCVCVWGVLQ